MMNTTIFEHMIDGYNTRAYTHEYIFGFEYKGAIYMSKATSSVLPFVLCLDRASRGAGYALRFKPNNGQKMVLMAGAEVLCSKEFFEAEVTSSIYNAGEIFEKLVTEKFGQTWVKDNVPFTQDGDLTVDGIAYQIKFNKATFINEKQLARLEG